jgi:hypothetical protein
MIIQLSVIGCTWLHLSVSVGMLVYVLLTYLITFSRYTLPALLMVLMLLLKFSVLIYGTWWCGISTFFASGFVLSNIYWIFGCIILSYLESLNECILTISVRAAAKDCQEKEWPSPLCWWAWERFCWWIGLHVRGCQCIEVSGNCWHLSWSIITFTFWWVLKIGKFGALMKFFISVLTYIVKLGRIGAWQ